MLARSLVVAGGTLGLGIWVPEAGLASRASPGWVVLVFLALLASSGGLALRQRLLAEERQQAGLAADLARREKELAAQIAEEQWRLLLAGAKELMLFLREEFVMRANRAAAKFLGFEHPGNFLGRCFLALVAAEEQGRVAKLLLAAAVSLGSSTTYLQGATASAVPWRSVLGSWKPARGCAAATMPLRASVTERVANARPCGRSAAATSVPIATSVAITASIETRTHDRVAALSRQPYLTPWRFPSRQGKATRVACREFQLAPA